MEQKSGRVSILMPCLNEEKTIGPCVERAVAFLEKNQLDGEVLVVDNKSSDASVQLATAAGARVVVEEEQGYGAALRCGIFKAEGERILMLDADGSYNIIEGTLFLERLEEGYDVVIGNRFGGTIQKGAMPFLHRYIGNPLLSLLGQKLSHTDIKDFHCGMRAFSKEKMMDLKLNSTQMEFASEMIMKAAKAGLRMTQVPCNLYCDGREGKSHLRPFRDGVRHLVCMWREKRRQR